MSVGSLTAIAAAALLLGPASVGLAHSPSEVEADSDGPTVAAAVRDVLSSRTVVASWVPGLPNSPEMGDDWERDDWDWVDQVPSLAESRQKSTRKAVLYSALLPGLGERYVGRPGRARFFHLTEAAIWSTFAYYRIQADEREERHIEFAQLNGGAATGQESAYYEHIGFWLSLEEWHDIVRRDARRRFPDSPAAQQDYFDNNLRYSTGQYWEWADDSERTRYRQLRSRTERSLRNARLATGAAIFNRLASMIDALALTRNHNREARDQEEARLEFRIGPRYTLDGLVVGPVLTKTY